MHLNHQLHHRHHHLYRHCYQHHRHQNPQFHRHLTGIRHQYLIHHRHHHLCQHCCQFHLNRYQSTHYCQEETHLICFDWYSHHHQGQCISSEQYFAPRHSHHDPSTPHPYRPRRMCGRNPHSPASDWLPLHLLQIQNSKLRQYFAGTKQKPSTPHPYRPRRMCCIHPHSPV